MVKRRLIENGDSDSNDHPRSSGMLQVDADYAIGKLRNAGVRVTETRIAIAQFFSPFNADTTVRKTCSASLRER
jgi:hypothetical protein